jgi:hypothetical protein
MLGKFLLSLGSLCLLFAPASAQFKIDRITNNLGFDTPKTFTLYTNSHFNRVEAFYLNLGVKAQPRFSQQPGQASAWTFYHDTGYGFKNEKNARAGWPACKKIFKFPTA